MNQRGSYAPIGIIDEVERTAPRADLAELGMVRRVARETARASRPASNANPHQSVRFRSPQPPGAEMSRGVAVTRRPSTTVSCHQSSSMISRTPQPRMYAPRPSGTTQVAAGCALRDPLHGGLVEVVVVVVREQDDVERRERVDRERRDP